MATLLAAALNVALSPADENAPANPAWTSKTRFRVLLTVDPRGKRRSDSPTSVEIDFQSHMPSGSVLDEDAIEVIALDALKRSPVPHRLDRLYGASKAALNFVLPNETCTRFAVYFDFCGPDTPSVANHERPQRDRYHGLVGDGDFFRHHRHPREINASHFDQFVDFDGDGDLDLFKGGVEPFVYCFENVGGNRIVDRGRLGNGGRLFALPSSKANRSWLTVAFYDVDGDGDQDFFPSFGDGPDAGRIIFYRNTTPRGEKTLAFTRVAPLRTDSGTPLAGGSQAGGWFPSITFVNDWDGDARGRLDALIGSNHRCWLYRGDGSHADGSPRFADPVPLQAAGMDIHLVNPRFESADIDADGDLDLFAGTQPGAIWLFQNIGTRAKPVLAAGRVVALDGKYLIGDAHSGVKIADFDGDGLLDLAAGRFWERTDLNHADRPRDFGGFYRNIGSKTAPHFARDTKAAAFTEQFQICDAVRQNSARAADWDADGRPDLLAGDTDGFIWLFRNQSGQRFPQFALGEKLRVGDRPLSVTATGGHARLDVCDWNNDGKSDLVVADGHGTLTLFRNHGETTRPVLSAGEPLLSDGKPIKIGGRASVLVCDWDHDRRKDLVLADDKGYYWNRNLGTDEAPVLAPIAPILPGGRPVRYVRPNLGSFIDWDGDGMRDFIGCHFENSIRLYHNLGPAQHGVQPRFANAEGIPILTASSPQMISGAHAVDWNGDGDIDLITGQGHGGSGLRFYERDWLEDELARTHPTVTVGAVQTKP
jgi:hypothetical protein